MTNLSIGTVGSPAMLAGDFDQRKQLIDQVENSAIDHFFIADHVSFHTGLGMDGIVNAATLAAMAPTKTIVIGVYLLALRHPVTVARQLSSLAQSAPGRIVFGVGVGGEDRHEMEVCGVDPATRGRQTNESLTALCQLMKGEPVSHECEFFSFENALIKPSPKPAIPVLVGGRADASIRRTARFADGWLGVWCSPARYKAVLAEIDELATGFNRQPDWQHGIQLWAGFDEDKSRARDYLARGMEDMYRVPFEKFEKYSPYGSPEEVAEFIAAYIDEGARIINIAPRAASEEAGIEAVSRVAELLKS